MPQAISKQTDREIVVAYKEQSTIGTPETGAGSTKIRFGTSPGSVLEVAEVASTESRDDGLARAPGRGRKQVTGSYSGPASEGTYDDLDQAVMRSTWTASATVDETNAGAITGIASNVVTVTNSTLISTDNLRVGMIATPGTGFDAADQNKRCFIAALTASTMTLVPVDGSTLTSVTPANWEITVARNIIQGTTDYAYTIEQYRKKAAKTEIFEWCRWGQAGRSLNPDQEVQRNFSHLGRNQADIGSSQTLTSPTESTTDAFQSAQTKLIIGTSQVVGLSQFTFNHSINPFRDDSVDELTCEIGVGQPTITTSISVLEDDLARVQSFINGDETFIGIITEYNETAPKGFEAIAFTKARFGSATPTGLGADRFSGRTHSLLIDADLRGGAFASTMLRLSTSAT